jgi:hypothetical protein
MSKTTNKINGQKLEFGNLDQITEIEKMKKIKEKKEKAKKLFPNGADIGVDFVEKVSGSEWYIAAECPACGEIETAEIECDRQDWDEVRMV